MSTAQQPEALRLADKYEVDGFLGDHRFAQNEWCRQAAAELRRQRARITELEKDASGYRWLRNQILGVDFDWCGNGITALIFEVPDVCAYSRNCDQNIDAAIAAQAKQGDTQS